MSELLTERVSFRGYDATSVASGQAALDSIEKDKPSLVLLDLPLHRPMGSEDVLKEIRVKHDKKSLPVVVLVNSNDVEDLEEEFTAEINGYLVKPSASTGEILSKIQEVLTGEVDNKEGLDKDKALKHKEKDTPAKPLVINIPKPAKGEESSRGSEEIKEKIAKILKSSPAEMSIIDLVDSVIEYSYLARASDIHLEPFDDKFIARLRIDGILHDVFDFPKEVQSGIITRIKVLGGIRTDEHRAALDGRFKASIKNPPREFDMRVSIVPTYYGENAILRLLAEQTKISKLDDLAFTPEDKKRIREAAQEPYGMILATGPTGSGKSTTLYTILRELNSRDVSIITIEDPIEYSIEGIDQIQVNNKTGLTFANGLRSILRQDPNVIMVGEIRDEETASIAVNAALTGHKMLSTLHTNDAATTLPRLLDMGVEPFLVASTINIAIGQRLVRVLCQSCKKKRRLTESEFQNLADIIPLEILKNHREFYFPKGCKLCGNDGYYDRMGIYEILEINDFIRDAIIRRADAGEIKKLAVKNGMITLLEDGFRKAVAGYTTIEEILRVVHE
jgi:type II secretory ATPase GspE/PulE/Tfp pilus assembly ATPase PilB-like protein